MVDKGAYAIGLDAGSAYTRCMICLLEGCQLRLLGAAEVPSEGWVKGHIADQRAVTESIRLAVEEAEREAQALVESLVVGIGGTEVRGANSRSRLELGRPREIEQRDVNRTVERGARVQLQEDRMVLQMFPQDFVVDEHPGHRDPRKMIASSIEANVHLITGSQSEHNCLVAAVNQAHLSVEETVFEGLAACYASVLPEERREGIVVADLGSQSTELVSFYGDALQIAATLPLCGDHFTRDVARALCMSFEDAEQLKEEYGCAMAAQSAENSWVEVPSPDDRGPREASRRSLNQVLEARAEELLQYLHEELRRVGMHRALDGGVVLTGGGAKLAGLCDLAEREMKCQARYGLAVGIRDWEEKFDDPAWTTVAGLAMYSARLRMHSENERQSAGVLGRILR